MDKFQTITYRTILQIFDTQKYAVITHRFEQRGFYVGGALDMIRLLILICNFHAEMFVPNFGMLQYQ